MASSILGFDIEDLCVNDPRKELVKTQFTQPALYVVNAFQYYELKKPAKPNFLIGHSLGEYNALLAAGVFDFETGLRLVKKRGELMAAASSGAMAAVVGLKVNQLKEILELGEYSDIDIANYNTFTQAVIAGPQKSIDKIVNDLDARGIKVVPLLVSAPFHSRYMQSSSEKFAEFLAGYQFNTPQIPVISNVTARPYKLEELKPLLATQISRSVRWSDTITYLMEIGCETYEQVGGGTMLTRMIDEIKKHRDEPASTMVRNGSAHSSPKSALPVNETAHSILNTSNGTLALKLGSNEFRQAYGIKYSYVAGGMHMGISSKELVVRMGQAGMLAYLGTAGWSLTKVEEEIKSIQRSLAGRGTYGVNFTYDIHDEGLEAKAIELFLKHNVNNLECAGYVQLTPSLVLFRLKGLRKSHSGEVVSDNRLLAKISRPEMAEAFMRPAPEKIVKNLLDKKLITEEQAELSKEIPLSHDICVVADSGGQTDRGGALTLLPAIQQLRDSLAREFSYSQKLNVGLGGGIGTPQAIGCAFVMGADFVLTGSINQCTVEANISNEVKDMLQSINVQDTDYAPTADTFEIGGKAQVLKKGVLFPARANKLYSLYTQYGSLAELPESNIEQIEKNYFRKSISAVWEDITEYYSRNGLEAELAKASENPRYKMALVFRWYFSYTTQLALEGSVINKTNFQVHTGPALGAFNQWAKGTSLEPWQNRHVDSIGIKLMDESGKLLEKALEKINHSNTKP